MTDTCGQSSTGLSVSTDLQSSLESKLQDRLAKVGSTPYRTSWKRKVTKSGRPFLQQVASARGTSVHVSTSGHTEQIAPVKSWLTPVAQDRKWRFSSVSSAMNRIGKGGQPCLEVQALLLNGTRYMACGARLIGSQPWTTPGGQLSPALSLWLMGYPTVWSLDFTATRSFHK